jgi:UDP-2,4-diacetamido-2,4,6-trideoxy-beta-L-altropyranose hydrolase
MTNNKEQSTTNKAPRTKHHEQSTTNKALKEFVFIIRADASFEIGAGHVMRCIALGQMLIDEGHQVIFLTQTDNHSIQERILKEGFGLITFCESDILKDAGYTANAGKDVKVDWVVTDGYKFTTEYQKIIKNAGIKLMCIDDICGCHYVSDVVLNQNINADKLFKYSREEYTKLLLGPDYLLFRKEFWEYKDYKRNYKTYPENILISLGGSEQASFLIPLILRTLLNNSNKFKIQIVLPNTTGFSENMITDKNASVFYGADKMAEFYKWADIGINCFGITSMEMIWMKLPFVSIGLNKNHKHFEDSFRSMGIEVAYFESISDKLNFVISNYSDYSNYFVETGFNVLDINKLFKNG